jgi:hypothetical protein
VGFNGTPMQTSAYRIPELQSEYGSCQDGGTNYDGCWDCFASTPGAMSGGLPVQFGWRSGAILWCAFDHGSDVGSNFGRMGMINNARLPQRRWYFYRNLYAGIAPPTWPVSGTAARLRLTTDRDTITDDGRTDAQLIVQVQNSSGAWLTNSPNITLTDQSGLGSFPTGTFITFNGGQQECGVLDGRASIEFRSYNAGAVTIQATSSGLTPASVPITVIHVPDDPVTVVRIPAVPHIAAGTEEMVVTGCGNRIALPRSIAGKKVAVSLFDMRGRLIEVMPACRAGAIVRRGAAEGIVIAKVKVVK